MSSTSAAVFDSFWTQWSLLIKWCALASIPVIYYWLWSRSKFVQIINSMPGPKYFPFLGNVLDLYVDRDGSSSTFHVYLPDNLLVFFIGRIS